MATWWGSYRTLLGSSSSGQWTMVASAYAFAPRQKKQFMHRFFERLVTAVALSCREGLIPQLNQMEVD